MLWNSVIFQKTRIQPETTTKRQLYTIITISAISAILNSLNNGSSIRNDDKPHSDASRNVEVSGGSCFLVSPAVAVARK